MKKTIQASSILFTIISFFFIPISHAETSSIQTIEVGGRNVLLNNDGRWTYQSTDRYADTKDGNRVRLKADGSWQYVGNALLTSKQQVRTAELDITLQKVVVETFKKKSNKSSRIKTQTVFYLDMTLSSLATNTVNITNKDIANIKIVDNTGRVYPVLSIQPSPFTLNANDKIILSVRAEKSPSFLDDVKSMTISLLPGIFNLKESISFTQKTIDFDEEKVEGFTD